MARTDTPGLFTLARRSFWLFFGGVFLVAGLLILVISAGLTWRESRFAGSGTTAEGIVLAKSIRAASAAEERGTEYIVSYRFTAASGLVVEGSDEISLERWEALTERGPIEVEYLADDPGQNRVAGADDQLLVPIMLGIGLLVAALGVGITLTQWRRLRGVQRLWRVGVVAEGTVTGVEPSNVTFNRRPLFHVRYEYTDAAGRRHAGASGYLSWNEAESWKAGDRVTIRYDPDASDRSIWIGAAASS